MFPPEAASARDGTCGSVRGGRGETPRWPAYGACHRALAATTALPHADRKEKCVNSRN
jgi:hypothetical protein